MNAGRPRILVTGSRTWPSMRIIRETLARMREVYPSAVLVHGGARGADQMAGHVWGAEFGLPVEVHPADWGRCVKGCQPGHRKQRRSGGEYCPDAGFRRNAHMVQLGADVAMVYRRNRSGGTTQCWELIECAGIRVIPVELNDDEDSDE